MLELHDAYISNVQDNEHVYDTTGHNVHIHMSQGLVPDPIWCHVDPIDVLWDDVGSYKQCDKYCRFEDRSYSREN